MASNGKSLRVLVNDWFGEAGQLRITRPGRSRHLPWRVVKVETSRMSGTFGIVFFRHHDGSWCVYPPSTVGPSMQALWSYAEINAENAASSCVI
ncbi:UNVERIFIED_ORG: hypothetical protein BDU10_9558 [Burkholderia sp. CF145]